MRVLVLSTCYPKPSQTGNGIFVHRQTRALAALGVECHVLQPIEWAPPSPVHHLHEAWRRAAAVARDTFSEHEGIPIHHPRIFFPVPSRFFPGDTWERTGVAVARYVARHRQLRSADLLFAHFLCHEGYAGVIAKRQLGIPLVAIARGDDVHGWPVRWPDRIPKLQTVFREADGLLACSAGLARDAAAWSREGDGRRIDVVYNGINAKRFHPADGAETRKAARRSVGLDPEGKYLLCVGTPIVEKGWLDMLDAFAALGAVASDWTLVGVGALRGTRDLDIVEEARTRGIGSRTIWLGTLPADLMPELYRAVDAFALPSHNEGLSEAVLEAMATALPVVATDVGGHAEIVEHGRNGWLIPPHDHAALTSALAEMLGDAEARARCGGAGRERALALGGYKENAKQLLRYFEEVLENRRRGVAPEKRPALPLNVMKLRAELTAEDTKDTEL
jgi:glycosyltransferase involved in cell wall biosynthesis